MTDCVYFQGIIKELNPSDSNTGDCCSWDMVECDKKGNIVKLDFKNYKGIQNKVDFPPSVQFLTKLEEFSINGQKNIKEIYSLPVNNLKKVDLSNSGLVSSNFPTWIMDAQDIEEIDISNTQMTGYPQREIKSKFKSCNFKNTPICASYQSSPYINFIPDICKSSCAGTVVNGNNEKKSSGGTKVWPFILIGVVVLAILGAVGFLYLKKKRYSDEKDNYDSPRPILPMSKRDEIEPDEVEVSIDSGIQNPPVIIKPVPTPAQASTSNAYVDNPVPNVAVPPAAAVNTHNPEDKKIEEINRNKQNFFGNRVNQQNMSVLSEQDQSQSYYPHPSIYNTMTTSDSDDEDSEGININEPIIPKEEKPINNQPALLRRKSSRKANIKKDTNPPPLPVPEPAPELYVANWDYTPSLSDELALVAGDVIEIKKKFDDGWSTGYNRRTKQTGIVPLCYLKEYED